MRLLQVNKKHENIYVKLCFISDNLQDADTNKALL